METELEHPEDRDVNMKDWLKNRIKRDQIDKYLDGDKCFIDDEKIETQLRDNTSCDWARLEEILQKSLEVKTLTPEETASLLSIEDPEMLARMEEVAGQVKKKVYDNRLVTFAPLYLSNYCVNNCVYCGFRDSNSAEKRRRLNMDEVRSEAEILAGKIGHKRLIVVYGEHPLSDADYIAETMQTIYNVKVPTKKGFGQIRRCNVNAAPMEIKDLELLHKVGIGTFQVFQETYHRKTYEKLHPANTIKGDYLWRLYCMHRSMEAGVDDVGMGVLFGLYDWKFEVMALLYHAIELEEKFGIGPHTISFPRIEPAENTPFATNLQNGVNDADFRKIVTVIRLAVPYTGMIITARESEQTRNEIIPLGCTQLDASSRIGIGAYSDSNDQQQGDIQQFILGDTRSLDDVIRELADAGYITSFCTAGYRCGRTGKCIMDLLRSGQEGKFCKLNAVLTFREWLDDFATPATLEAGERIIAKEIAEIKEQMPAIYPEFEKYYQQTAAGKRDMYF